MTLPLLYNLRHLRVRWRSSLAAIISIAMVVAVFVMVMALARGLRSTYLRTGEADNLLVIRRGSMAESSSQITIDEVRRIQYLDEIALDGKGDPLFSAEVMILITRERKNGGKAHVQVRGLGSAGRQLRPHVKLVQGRAFEAGKRECIVSRSVAGRFKDCSLGQQFKSGKGVWTVVGIFDGRKTAFDSEIWVDADEAREAFSRPFYSSVTMRPRDAAAIKALADRIHTDKQVHLRVLTEEEYYAEQTKTAAPIQIFGACLAGLMSIGAAFSAMNTMYASVGARTREIATLRVFGFKPHSVYLAFIFESLLIAGIGGLLGCLLSLPIHGLATGTFNWSTFAEVAFEFRITPGLLAAGVLFSLIMGLLGGLLPARAAARQPVLDGLRAT